MAGRFHRFAWALVLAVLVVLVAADRARWAEVAQWREDQSCNLWIGYSQDPLKMPVGLISSVGTPNPNGMPLLAVPLSRLPNLWAISAVIGVLQGLLVLWVCWLITGPGALFFVIALPSLCSILLRATSVEFWNQWMMTSFNLLFFGLWIAYVRRRSPVLAALAIWPMLYAPAAYLAGLLNAVVYFGFMLVAVLLRPPQLTLRRSISAGLVALALLGSALALTWVPYAEAMSSADQHMPEPAVKFGWKRVFNAVEAGLQVPRWSLTHFHSRAEASFLHGSPRILGKSITHEMRRASKLLYAQCIVFMIAASIALVGWCRPRRRFDTFFVEGRALQGRLALACLGFVAAAHVTSPLLGGPDWVSGSRPDQQVQLLPFLMFAWFLFPFTVNLPAWCRWPLQGTTAALAVGFSALSLVIGLQIVDKHLAYRGDVLTDADVPLQHQRSAMEFIARDWKRISPDPQIPVSYRHGQDWVIDFGKQLERWYPAPMTVGRAFDYELRRTYGLTNSQEGVQHRSASEARYIVSYAFEKRPRVEGARISNYLFGRVRVSVVQRAAQSGVETAKVSR